MQGKIGHERKRRLKGKIGMNKRIREEPFACLRYVRCIISQAFPFHVLIHHSF